MNTAANPPKYAERFFRWFCHNTHLEGLEGDLFELFEHRVEEQGIKKARFFYILDIITLLRPSTAKSISKYYQTKYVTMGIINNYLKTTLRMGKKRMWFTAINLIGLTLGIASVLFISIFVNDELKFDTHISNADQKFRIYDIRRGDGGVINYLPIVPPIFAPSLKENFPQVVKAGRIMFDYGGTVFNIEDKAFSEKNGVFAEIEALEILDLQMVSGDLNRMGEPLSVILSESTFQKFFGDVPFNNQTIKLARSEFQVLGIFKNLPDQSHLDIDYIFSFEYAIQNTPEERMNSWVWQQFYTYVQLQHGVDVKSFQSQFQLYITEQAKPHTEEYQFYYTPYLQSLSDIHLHSSNFEWDIAKRGNYQSIVFLSLAAAIILLIACLNFVNLTTAQALKRAKEVCIRKFVGARRSQLLIQYGMEATLYTMVAGILSLLILVVLLPYFSHFTGKTFLLTDILSPFNTTVYLSFLLLLGIMSGAYPALLITSFKPLMALQGLSNIQFGKGKSGLKIDTRQVLVGAQYILSIGLILMSLVIQKQYKYLQDKDMGFNKDNLVVIPLSRSMRNDYINVRETFANQSAVSKVGLSYGIPGGIVAGDGVYLPGRGDLEYSCNMFMVDEYYISTLGMDMLAGRDFDPEMSTDASEAFILNETAVKNFGLGSPQEAIGESVHWKMWSEDDSLKMGRVVGVVADFNFKSLHNEMSSVVLHMGPNHLQNIVAKLEPSDIHRSITQLEEAYRTFEPDRPFEFNFIDQTFKKFYESEQKLSWLFSIFTILAIITAGIGLFGSVSFNIISRSREIGIRKVLGAGVNSVVQLLVWRYFFLVAICLILATPVAYFFAAQWLENFSFRVSLDAWIFIEVVVITLIFSIATVGIQAYRGAVANPSDKIRTE